MIPRRHIHQKCACGETLPLIAQNGESFIFATRQCDACKASWNVGLQANYETRAYDLVTIKAVKSTAGLN